MSDLGNLDKAFAKRILIIPAILLIICAFLSFYFISIIPSVVLSLPVMTAAALLFCKKKAKIHVVLTLFLLCAVLIYIGAYVSFRLRAVEEPRTDSFTCHVISVNKDLSGGFDVTVELDSGAFAVLNYYGKSESFTEIKPGDRLRVSGTLKEPRKAGNPGEFDYREFLLKKGVRYVLTCDRFKVSGRAGFPYSLTGVLQDLFFEMRRHALEVVSDAFPEEYKALSAALCLGDKSLLSDDVKRDFKMSCCTHLLAVSGTHFAGFLACLPLMLSALNIKGKKAFAIHVLFCFLIGCLTGWNSSVTRAAIMSICFFAERDWLSALSLASCIMTIADPFCPLSGGFQMSFCAVIGIKIYSGRIVKFIRLLHIGEKTASFISPSIAATLGMIPFWSDIAMHPDVEHILIQIVASFITGIICTCFIPTLLLCLIFPFISQYLSAPLLLCIKALHLVVSAGCRLSVNSGAPVHLDNGFLILLSLTVFLFMIPNCQLRRVCFKPVAVILAVAIGFQLFPVFNRPSCKVVFADVGQGDCCLIITRDKTCLIDAGTYEKGASTVRDLLDYYGIPKVDYCIMSHWDTDHAGGIAALCAQGRTDTILTAYVPEKNDQDKDVTDFFNAVTSKGLERSSFMAGLKPVLAGNRIVLSESVYIDVLYPSERTGGGNEESLVLMLHIEDETSILFTGDIGVPTEETLVVQGINLDCNILKVAHHGSKYSSSSEFITACSPSVAVISVGANNFYGHPSPYTLSRLGSYGCKVFRTDQEGAVIMEF